MILMIETTRKGERTRRTAIGHRRDRGRGLYWNTANNIKRIYRAKRAKHVECDARYSRHLVEMVNTDNLINRASQHALLFNERGVCPIRF